MANTFTPLGPSSGFPGTRQPSLPVYTFLNAPIFPPPGTGNPNNNGGMIPIKPLPGSVGVGSYAI